jgi:hypothetical protein
VQWLQDRREINCNQLNNLRCGDRRYSRKKEGISERKKLMSLQQTVRKGKWEICMEE